MCALKKQTTLRCFNVCRDKASESASKARPLAHCASSSCCCSVYKQQCAAQASSGPDTTLPVIRRLNYTQVRLLFAMFNRPLPMPTGQASLVPDVRCARTTRTEACFRRLDEVLSVGCSCDGSIDALITEPPRATSRTPIPILPPGLMAEPFRSNLRQLSLQYATPGTTLSADVYLLSNLEGISLRSANVGGVLPSPDNFLNGCARLPAA